MRSMHRQLGPYYQQSRSTDRRRGKCESAIERRRRIPQRLGPAVTIDDTVDVGVDITEGELSGAAVGCPKASRLQGPC
jgi:hypothetical protein